MRELLKVAKLLPKLGSSFEHERLATISAIERVLASASITWTDAGQQLAAFIESVTVAEIEEVIAPVFANGNGYAATNTGFAPGRTATPPPRQAPPQATRPQPAPPPSRNRVLDPRLTGTPAQQADLISAILNSVHTVRLNKIAKSKLRTMESALLSGMPISALDAALLRSSATATDMYVWV